MHRALTLVMQSRLLSRAGNSINLDKSGVLSCGVAQSRTPGGGWLGTSGGMGLIYWRLANARTYGGMMKKEASSCSSMSSSEPDIAWNPSEGMLTANSVVPNTPVKTAG